MRLQAQTDVQKLEADMLIEQLQGRREILLAEQGSRLTSWIRPALAFPVVVLMFKLIIYDTVLALGVTPDPGTLITWYVMTVTGAYMLTRPLEKVFKSFRK